jgi:hypothetical protein
MNPQSAGDLEGGMVALIDWHAETRLRRTINVDCALTALNEGIQRTLPRLEYGSSNRKQGGAKEGV